MEWQKRGGVAGATEKRGSGRTGGKRGNGDGGPADKTGVARLMGKEGNGGPADKTGVARLMGKEVNGGPADKTGVAPIKSGAHLL